jgi:hypothetical protein
MMPTKLTNALKQALRDQVITSDQPGPVLRDFRILLEFLGRDGVEAGGKYHLLPIKIIDELDGLLSHPLRLELQRPQIKSHPYIQGLNLLLRASGLARVQKSGAKPRLVLDRAMLDQWNDLNYTEQYFQLLEAWLRVGRAEMIGERGRSFRDELAWSCIEAWNVISAEGFRRRLKDSSQLYVPGFYGNLYLLALMDLFGLVKVEHYSRPVTPWRPAEVEPAPFGDAVLTLLMSTRLDPVFAADLSKEDEEDAEEPAMDVPRFGVWQPLFQPYFPEWEKNLEFPQSEPRKGVFIFRVSLGKVWRRIAMPADTTLDDLVDMILRSVEFDSDHLYEFRYIDRMGAEVTAGHPATDEGPWADQIKIGTLPLEPGQEMKLTYDFGDNWEFKVKLERVEATDTKSKKPRILESHGKAPEQYPNWDE